MKGIQAVDGKVRFAGVTITPQEAAGVARELVAAAGAAIAQQAQAMADVKAKAEGDVAAAAARLDKARADLAAVTGG